MNKTVLVADNDRVLVAAIGDALRAEGFTVSVAFDGLEALDVARRVHPDVILLDLIMPKMDGRRVCRLLKADPLLARTPVIVLTGLGPEGLASAAALGATACLAKGPLEEMLAELRRLLRDYGEGRVATALPEAPSARLLRGRRIVAELHALGRHLETVLATLGEGIVEVDAGGRVVSVNPAGLALLGCPEEELIGVPAASLLGGECEEDVRALLAPAAAGAGQPRSRVFQYRDASLHLTASELRDEEGDAGSLLVLQDLTEVSQKLEELSALEEIARLLSGQPDPAEALPAVVERVRRVL